MNPHLTTTPNTMTLGQLSDWLNARQVRLHNVVRLPIGKGVPAWTAWLVSKTSPHVQCSMRGSTPTGAIRNALSAWERAMALSVTGERPQ